MEQTVIREKSNKIGILTMNRPKKLNSLNDDLLISLYEGIKEFDQDDDVRVIILRASGRSFCAGYDLSPREDPFVTVNDWLEHAYLGNRTFYAIWNSTKPVIAAVQGHCLGGGCGLSLVCDFTLASENAYFGEPEIQFGSSTPFMLLPWIVGMKRAKSLVLTGDQITAREAENIGLVTKVVADEDLDSSALDLARKLVKIPVPAMRLNKEAINRSYEMAGFLEALHTGELLFGVLHTTVMPEKDQFFKVMAEEGLPAAFKWRDAKFAD